MQLDSVVGQHELQFATILERFGIVGDYVMYWRWCKTNQNVFGTITVMHQQSGATESYYAGYLPDNPKYWANRLSQALANGTFGKRY